MIFIDKVLLFNEISKFLYYFERSREIGKLLIDYLKDEKDEKLFATN